MSQSRIVQPRSLKTALYWCLALCLTMAAAGCKAGRPGNAQTNTFNWIKHHVTVGGKRDRNPLQATPDTIAAGKQAFGSYCVACHGRDGQNTGVPFASSIDPPIPLLSSSAVQSYTDGQLKRVIEAGISPSGMPASNGILSDEEMWQIVIYIRHLPPAGSLGDPKAYGGDEFGDPGDSSPATKNQ
jgi:mono/diheme cytochrome c family protein